MILGQPVDAEWLEIFTTRLLEQRGASQAAGITLPTGILKRLADLDAAGQH